MKKFPLLCILVILLVAASGCTQPAPAPGPVTPVATPVPLVTTQIPAPAAIPPAITGTAVAPKSTVTRPGLVPQENRIVFYFRNNTLTPKELVVLPGTGIAWVNDDTTVHSVAATGDHTGMFDSGDIIPTATWGYTFGADEGRYEFKDKYSGLTGVVIVRNGPSVVGAPSMETPAPATTRP